MGPNMRVMSASYRDQDRFARLFCDLASAMGSANPPPGPQSRSVPTYPDIVRVLPRTRNNLITSRKYGLSRPRRTTISVVLVGPDSAALQTSESECAARQGRAKNVNPCEKT